MNQRTIQDAQIIGFEQLLRSEERVLGTIDKYLRDIRSFGAWLGNVPLDKEACTGWKEHLQTEKLCPETVNSKLSALNKFLKFIHREDCCIKYLRIQHRLFRRTDRDLTKADYARLLETANSMGRTRLALLMETICATGIRVSELRYITLAAVRLGRAEIALKGKLRTILLPAKLCRKLQAYARKHAIASGELFLTARGKPLGRRQIWGEMKGLCPLAGVEKSKVFPHNLRHLFATTFYQSCKDIARLADVLGHSSIETTRVYLLTTGREHRRALDRLGLVS